LPTAAGKVIYWTDSAALNRDADIALTEKNLIVKSVLRQWILIDHCPSVDYRLVVYVRRTASTGTGRRIPSRNSKKDEIRTGRRCSHIILSNV